MEEQLVNREIKFNVPKKLTKAEFDVEHALDSNFVIDTCT